MSTDTHATPGATDAEADATEGRVYNVSGGDWDEIVTEDSERGFNEQIVVNMGPQHPSTHGVLRLVLTLEGETVNVAASNVVWARPANNVARMQIRCSASFIKDSFDFLLSPLLHSIQIKSTKFSH